MKRLVLDTETTGFYPDRHKVLTVGMMLIDVTEEFLDILDSSHILIKHNNYNADPDSLAVNKIDLIKHHEVALEPSIACREINSFIGKNILQTTPILGHNINFDRGFLGILFERANVIPWFHNEFEDTMLMWNFLKKRGVIPYNLRANLGTVAEFFGVDYSKAHDALVDCHITAQVYHNLLKLIKRIA